MSKKIAEGTGALVLDVKVGTGAFMKDVDRARELAETMVALGTDAGVHTVALLTDMSTPLGLTAGNAIEVAESVEVLAGGGPADVVELTLALAREMLGGRRATDVDPADVLADGSAMDAWNGDDPAQGGDPDAALPVARESSRSSAAVRRRARELDAMAVGVAAWRLGAGPGPQGGPGAGRRRRRVACPARRRGHRRAAAVHAAHRRAGSVRPRPRRARGRLESRTARRTRRAAAHRPGQLSSSTTRGDARRLVVPSISMMCIRVELATAGSSVTSPNRTCDAPGAHRHGVGSGPC